MHEPSQSPKVEAVLQFTDDELLQNPTKLEMVQDLVIRHSFATYPFEWFSFNEKEVAEAYIEYVGAMLGEEVSSEGPLQELFVKIDMIFEMRGL